MKDVLPVPQSSALPQMLALQVGDPAPSFEGAPLKGRAAVRLDQYRGHVVWLEFWASWSGPARQSLPWAERLHRDHQAAGLEAIGISIDAEPADAVAFLKRHPVGFPVVSDAKDEIAALYNVQDVPSSYLIDRGGVLRAVFRGFTPADSRPRLREVAALLREPR
jgi:cytochrome c biogenesis protein CcmG, thiol:disulfide interchange protein DsbE